MVDLTRWPEVTVRGVTVTLRLPVRGAPGHHVCETGVNECADCKLARAAQDEVLRARMLEERMSAMPNLRGPGSDGFYDGLRGVLLPRREEV